MTKRLYRRDEAARYLQSFGLRTTAASLATMATRGGGPVYRKEGRYCVYDRDDLYAWAMQRCTGRLDSTSTEHRLGTDPISDSIDELDDNIFITGQPDFDEITNMLNSEEELRHAMNEAGTKYHGQFMS